jgi:predicted AAA+ superfamily ATPase
MGRVALDERAERGVIVQKRDQVVRENGSRAGAQTGVEGVQKRYRVPVTTVDYIPRLADARLEELFSELPALLIVGPRATGKTTTARRHARTVVRLDSEAEAGAFRADPDVALRALATPVLLDEWQAVPSVLGAVKRAVDDEAGAGRFLLTGSVNADLETQTWPGTGRLVRVQMYGLTVREMTGRPAAPPFLDRLARADLNELAPAPDPPDLLGYVELALRGGFPEAALRLADASRQAWLEGYIDQLLTRDVEALYGQRDPRLLRRFFEALALNTAGMSENKTLYDAAGIDRKTAIAYERLLTNLLVLETMPAWANNRLSRLVKTGKRYLTDPSLVGAALRLDAAAVLRDGDLLGRILDTFVVAQIRSEAELSPSRPRLHHLRARDGRHEVDLVAELPANGVVAIEIKATASPKAADGRHLVWMRDQLGDRFLAGAVLHTGPRPFQLAERVLALPICTLWA